MAQPCILLDMDEVLTDFVGGACRAHGWTREGLASVQSPGVWGMAWAMHLTEDEFWAPINAAGKRFWMELQPLPWWREVLTLVKSLTKDWYIVSCPSRDPESYSGKAGWLKYQFRDGAFNRFVLTSHKHLLATPGTILIDDNEDNVHRFINAGGYGILFPCRHNKLHEYAHDPVGYITQLFKGANDAPSLP